MRRNRYPGVLLVVLAGLAIFLIGLGIRSFFSPLPQVKKTVEIFYDYEKNADFASSWKLFHPYMKQKFPKTIYIQDRSHVFIGHFGAETFTYTQSEPEEIEGWRPEKGYKPFSKAYKIIVTQTYKGKYGKFNFQQDVYVVHYKDEWVILWNYNM